MLEQLSIKEYLSIDVLGHFFVAILDEVNNLFERQIVLYVLKDHFNGVIEDVL